MMPRPLRGFALAFTALALVGTPLLAQSFSLDDNPSAPLTGPFVPPHLSAEDPYGVGACAPGLTGPSPSLAAPGGPYFDSDGLLAGPALDFRWVPNIDFVNAFSSNHALRDLPAFNLRFSVDRAGAGVGGSAVAAQAALGQHPADIFTGVALFPSPKGFLGSLLPGCPVLLPSAGVGGTNRLFIDQAALGLGPATGPIGAGTHDNVDAYEEFISPLAGTTTYFSYPPAQAAWWGAGDPAALYWAPGGVAPPPVPAPWATAGQIGLVPGADDIDALLVWDWSASGAAVGGMDYALFSLAPGSASLAACGLSDAHVFFTDFSGAFGIFALPGDLGLVGGPGCGGIDALGNTPC